MYKYETHCHTSPSSKCGLASAEDTIKYYKSLGYDGVFITNHFIDGNIGCDRNLPYKDKLDFYFADYLDAKKISSQVGIKVFLGVELSYGGTDFLIYGLKKEWFYAHPEIENMKKSDELTLLKEAGALVIQAHPYREAVYIDHIRLFPRHVDGAEVFNAGCNDHQNKMAEIYVKEYGLLPFAGSDNHNASFKKDLAGIKTERPITDELDFKNIILGKQYQVFYDK